MKLHEAETLGNTLMKLHGLNDWTFKFDNSVRRFGACMYRGKIISLSRKMVEINNVSKVKNTILHEIAHAIAGYRAGHGNEWKEVCIRIGAKPERCYSSKDTNVVKLKYYAVCGACGKEHEKARIKYKERKRSCLCQSGIDWDNRVLLEYKER